MTPKLQTALAVGIFIAISFTFFHQVLVGDRVLITCNTSLWYPWRSYADADALRQETYRTDSALTYLPRQTEVTRSLRAGRFPLWNPYAFGGCPFLADPQSRALYPPTLLLAVMDPARALGFDVAIHFVIAMLGMFLFLRIIKSTVLGSMLGALAYGLSSFFFLRMGHPTFVAAASWIPYLFYAYEESKLSERAGTVLLIVFLSLGYLAGMPQVFLFGVAALVIYALYEALEVVLARPWKKIPVGLRPKGPGSGDSRPAPATGRATRGGLKGLEVIAVAGGISLMVVAVQFLPFIEFTRHSRGLGLGFDLMREEHLWHPIFLLRTLIPDFFGNPIEGTSWLGAVKGAVHPYNAGFMVYCGMAGILLAISSLVFLKSSRQLRGLLLLLGLSLAVGSSAPFLKLVYLVLPIAAYSQIDRISVIACFAIAAMAGKGMSLASGPGSLRARRAFAVVLTISTLVMVSGWLLFESQGSGVVSMLSDRVRNLMDQPWFRRGAFRLAQWIEAGGDQWHRYQSRQMAWASVLAVLGLVLVLVHLRSRRLAGLAAGAVLAALLALDLGLAGRHYYVTQARGSLGPTDGIKVLKEMLGAPGTWRIGGLIPRRHAPLGQSVLPANTPELFELPAFDGANALIPAGYVERVQWSLSSGDALEPQGAASGQVGDLMGVRYLVSADLPQDCMVSSVLESFIRKDQPPQAVGVVNLSGDARLCLRQDPNDSCGAEVLIPQCQSLSFCLGLVDVSDTSLSDSIRIGLTCAAAGGPEARFERVLSLDTVAGRWQEFRLDVSALAGSYARVVLENSCGAGLEGGSLAWGLLHFVIEDCPFSRVDHGYGVRLGRGGELLRVSLSTPAGGLPLKLGCGGDRGEAAFEWVSPLPGSSSTELMLDVASLSGATLFITSSLDFTITGCELVYSKRLDSARLRPVYSGDMYVLENSMALPKGICLNRELFASEGGRLEGSGRINLGQVMPIFRTGVCGWSIVEHCQPERVDLRVQAQAPCLMLLQDTYYPGWKAFVDGAGRPILETDLGIGALELEPGTHHVRLEFLPASLRIGIILSCVGVVLAIIYASRARGSSW